MPKITSYEPGRFCWADLATTDAEGAKRFYTAIFGWEFKDIPVGEGMVYSVALQQGEEVAALYQLREDERQKGAPPRWQNYVAVKSADKSAEKATRLGGSLLAPPFDVFENGRMAIIADPTGAVLNIWEANAHAGAALVGEPGTLCWNELMTNEMERARTFYSALFEWEPRAMEGGPFPYTVFNSGGQPVAGLMPIPPDCKDTHPSWLIYFLVTECDETAELARTSGAKIFKEPTDIPSIGRFSVVQDPQGAVFALFKPAQM